MWALLCAFVLFSPLEIFNFFERTWSHFLKQLFINQSSERNSVKIQIVRKFLLWGNKKIKNQLRSLLFWWKSTVDRAESTIKSILRILYARARPRVRWKRGFRVFKLWGVLKIIMCYRYNLLFLALGLHAFGPLVSLLILSVIIPML